MDRQKVSVIDELRERAVKDIAGKRSMPWTLDSNAALVNLVFDAINLPALLDVVEKGRAWRDDGSQAWDDWRAALERWEKR